MNRILLQLALSIIYLISVEQCRGQNTPVTSFHALTYYNVNNNSFVCIDDSNKMYEYYISTHKWCISDFVYEAAEPFEFFKQNYLPVVAGKEVYFVYRGCGEVYTFKNDTIKRHDQSFKHRNQYGASVFSIGNQICFFGGYGLFTPKNIITAYDATLKQWFELTSKTNNKPMPQNYAIHQVYDDKLVITGGLNCDPFENTRINDVWSFDAKSNEWNLIGNLTQDFYQLLYSAKLVTPNQPVFFLKENDKLYILNLHSNKYDCYSSSDIKDISELIPDNTFNYVLTKTTNNYLNSYTLKVIPLKELIANHKIWTKPIYLDQNLLLASSQTVFKWEFLLVILSIVLLLLFIIKFLLNKKRKSENKLIWKEFDEKEQLAINLLLTNEMGIEISQLNDLFSDLEIGYEALKKRREHFIKDLKLKISNMTGFSEDVLFLEYKNPNDKRIKIIQLKKKIVFTGRELQ